MVRNHVTTLDEKSPVRAVSEQEDEEVAALVRDESNQSKPYFTALFNSFRNKAANLLRHPKAPLYLPILLAFGLLLMGGADRYLGAEKDPMIALASKRRLSVATWNIAAINNNPFEYWITYDENPEYQRIMQKIEEFIENPGSNDVPVKNVFTEDMFSSLERRMNAVGWPNVRSYWENDFRNRRIVSGFMKDEELGSKRLASMPDRITNTINVAGSEDPVCRPTVINMYDGDLGTTAKWWTAWEKFMFDESLTIKTKDGDISKKPYEMLQGIKKAKYPAITEQEERDSLPLQTMCGAIFDSILVHMMNTVSNPSVWQPLKKKMVDSLNKKKVPHTLEILNDVYGNSDIITLQEVSSSLIDQAKHGPLGKKFWVAAPRDMDPVRDQNSVILLSKETFPEGVVAEITERVEASFPSGTDVPVAKGDINAITTVDKDGTPYVVASFHGDTNGLATIPVNDAIVKLMETSQDLLQHKLIFGLDANTYEKAKPGKQQDVLEWGKSYVSHGQTSCWGDVPQPSNYTTFNARTYLQPQLNKACKSTEKRDKGDVNPKDFIVFKKQDFDVVKTWKDNTGDRRYIEDMAFPTLKFPSDHGILATILERKY